MKVLAVIDKKHRVQHARINVLQNMTGIDFLLQTVKGDRKQAQKMADNADAVYYASAGLYWTFPLKHKRLLGSVTSHKDVPKLQNLHKISVNNKFLLERYQSLHSDVSYIPNGVDTKFFSCEDKQLSSPIVIGWCGNMDRAVKNFDVVKKLMASKIDGIRFEIAGTLKRHTAKELLTREQMVKFYGKLHYFLVTSTAEGTPNPALEAASCGVPLIATRVGNMPDIVSEGTGFFVESNENSIGKMLKQLKSIDASRYSEMRQNIRGLMRENWDWSHRQDSWQSFFSS